MPENDDMQRFDALLDAMLTKPGPDPKVKQEPHPEPEEGDLREGDGD